jgi:hypothetical protein
LAFISSFPIFVPPDCHIQTSPFFEKALDRDALPEMFRIVSAVEIEFVSRVRLRGPTWSGR